MLVASKKTENFLRIGAQGKEVGGGRRIGRKGKKNSRGWKPNRRERVDRDRHPLLENGPIRGWA